MRVVDNGDFARVQELIASGADVETRIEVGFMLWVARMLCYT